jgi:ABC-type transporter Mla MlaB component
VLDITVQPPEEYINKFDVVINVSTVEEVDADHLEIIKNLLMQVRVGGYLIITFDLPGMQLRKLERLFNISISVIAMI